MRWFVRDTEFARMEQRHRDELTLLREDRERELARMVDPQGPFVAHLKSEVAFWRLQFAHERQRAEVAIDQCRATHQGIGPVSLPLRDETAPPQTGMAGIFSDPELASMGLTEGV